MRIKKSLLVGFLISSVAAFANYIEDAAKMVNNGEMKISDLRKDFSMEEIKQIDAKSKELKIAELTEKKEKEKEQQEIERSKKLQEIRNKQKQEAKDKILVGDLEKSANRRFEKLETRVSNLEKHAKTTNVKIKNSSNTAAAKSTNSDKKIQKVSKSEAIQNILRGKYGDGDTRKLTLKKLGFNEAQIKEIQKEVNRIIETDHIKVNLD